MSSAGLTSRRKADDWIISGRVRVNGRLVDKLGIQAVWGRDKISVDGKEIPGPAERLYLMLNKPFGYMSSLKDPEGRPVVTDLVQHLSQRVYPVGRLDFDTLGLLLLTNDGEWAHRMTHPSYQIPRTYKATVSGRIDNEAIALLRKGVILEDGPAGPTKADVISRNENRSVARVTITQGRNRQVRRMLESVGYRVIHLVRIGFGSLVLGDLKVGDYRQLTTEEVKSLRNLVGLK